MSRAMSIVLGFGLTGILGGIAQLLAQPPAATPAPVKPEGKSKDPSAPTGSTSDIELVEKLIASRKAYQASLENLYRHYNKVDAEKAAWAESELREFHRVTKNAYRLEMFVPVESLQPKKNIPEANELLRQAMTYKGRGSGTDAIDNQRRSELLLQYILDKYYESDKIPEVAYQLGETYSDYRPKPQYRLAAAFYERSWQWGPAVHPDARMKAARIYDKSLSDQVNAVRLYKEVRLHDADDARLQEASKRLVDLTGRK